MQVSVRTQLGSMQANEEPSSAEIDKIGVVVIGRNEGERLHRCLEAVQGRASCIVYVDSGSTDGSVDLARSLGVAVHELDTSIPFTAGRARNEGCEVVVARCPDVAFVQFVDGDCELTEDWLGAAARQLELRPDLGAVRGRRRERYPEASIYNRLQDMEWEQSAEEASSFAGEIMVRTDAFRQIGGYTAEMISGEDPDLLVRLRESGWRIEKLDRLCSLHDAAMTSFGQWWKRCVRNGFGFMHASMMGHGSSGRLYFRQALSTLIWTVLFPLALLGLAWPLGYVSLLGLLVYPLWVLKIAIQRSPVTRDPLGDGLIYGSFCMLSKWPQLIGQLRYAWFQLRGLPFQNIYYKQKL